MSEKRLSMVDTGQFEAVAIIQDDDKVLVMRAVIAYEIVQQYVSLQYVPTLKK